MARIAGVDIPREKRVVIALTYIYGIGKAASEQIVAGAQIDPSTRVKDLDEAQVTRYATISIIIWSSRVISGVK